MPRKCLPSVSLKLPRKRPRIFNFSLFVPTLFFIRPLPSPLLPRSDIKFDRKSLPRLFVLITLYKIVSFVSFLNLPLLPLPLLLLFSVSVFIFLPFVTPPFFSSMQINAKRGRNLHTSILKNFQSSTASFHVA